MSKNLGSIDRTIRVVVGLALLSLLVLLEGNARLLGLVGLVPLVTAAIGYCPLYSIFGVRTCPLKGTVAGVLVLAALGSAAYTGETMAGPPNDFRAWTHVKSMVIPDKIHGFYGFHNVYVNKAALPVLKAGGKYKDGSAFVVSFYDVNVMDGMTMQGAKKMDAVMIKDKKASGSGGWAFAAYGPDGGSLGVDPVKACFECHAQGAKDSEFVFSKWIE